jgi:hypothetical protein
VGGSGRERRLRVRDGGDDRRWVLLRLLLLCGGDSYNTL